MELDDVVFVKGLTFLETAQSQGSDIQSMSFAIKNFFCHKKAADRTMHKTVT